jgi:hypothetical protein
VVCTYHLLLFIIILFIIAAVVVVVVEVIFVKFNTLITFQKRYCFKSLSVQFYRSLQEWFKIGT